MKSAILFASLLLACTSVDAATIGLYTNPAGFGEILNLDAQESATIHVIAKAVPTDLQLGYTAAEFRIVGLPSGWVATATPDPALNVIIGDVLGNGVDMAWPTAQVGQSALFTVEIFATTQEADVLLEVVQHVTPSGWGGPVECPLLQFYYCGACDFGPECVDGGSLWINLTGLAVEDATWTAVRTLYR